jgi:TP901 family phage tail tape measure protein
MAVTAREVVYKIIGDTDSFVKGFDKAEKELDDFEKKTKAADKILGDISKKAAIATTAIVATGAAFAKMAIDFNSRLAKIETLIPGQTDRINELKQAIQELSPEVRKATDDLTDGAYNIISAYGDADDTVQKLEISAKAASAGVATTNDAINLLSATTKAYGDTSAIAQQKVADLAFVTLRNGQTTFPELASSIQRVTSLSAELNVSQEELFAVFSAGTGVIGGAAEVSTKSAAALRELLTGTDRLNAAFSALGVKTGSELIQNFGGFQGALQAIKTYADETDQSITNLFGSAEAGQIALYLTGAGAEKFTKDLTDMHDAAGALNTAFGSMTGGINAAGDAITQARLNASVFAQRLGDEVLESAKGLLDTAVSVTDALAGMDEETLKNIVSIGKIAATALGLIAGLAGVSKGLLAAKTAAIALRGAMTALATANPIGLVIAGVLTAAVAINEVSKRVRETDSEIVKAAKNESGQAVALTKEYEQLTAKTELTYLEKKRLVEVSEELRGIYPGLTGKVDENTGAVMLNLDAVKKLNQAKNIEVELLRLEEKLIAASMKKSQAESAYKTNLSKWQGDLNYQKEQLLVVEQMIQKAKSEFEKKSLEPNRQQTLNSIAQIEGWIELERIALEDATEQYNESLKALEAKQKQRDELSSPSGSAPLVPPAGSEEVTANPGGSQGAQLKVLDDSYRVQAELAERSGEDIYQIEQEWQQKRIALLEGFIQEDVASRKEGVSVAQALNQSLESSLAEGYGSILSQLEKSQGILDDLSAKSLALDIDASVAFLSGSGLSVEDALKKIRDEARNTADEQLNNTKALTSEQNALNLSLADGNTSDEARSAILSRLQAITLELADAEKIRGDALSIESEASAQLLAADISRIDQTRERTEEAVNREIELKKELGLLGSNEKEIERNSIIEKRNALLETQTSLISQYNDLMASGNAEDLARAEAVKNELLEIKDSIEALGDAGGNIFNEMADQLKVFADKFAQYFRGAVDLATGIISSKAEKQAQQFNKRLESIETSRNSTLDKLDNEMYDLKEEHRNENAQKEEAYRIENLQRELEYRQKLYEERQAQYERDITELQAAFDSESNIEKLRDLEKQIEAEKKKKREAEEQRKKDEEDRKRSEAQAKEEKKRAEDQLARENDILNRRAQAEWEYAAASVETENAAGTAAANAAIEQSRWEKAATVTSLTLSALENAVRAAAAFPVVPAMIAYGAAAALSTANAIVAGTQPDPPGYTPQALPPPPRKLASGGIFLPRAGGTSVLLSDGSPADVAEAGIPEIYLPLTRSNMESLFSAAGVGSSGSLPSLSYSPVFNLTFSDTDTVDSAKEDFLDFLRSDAQRDLLEIVEDARRKYFVGGN